VLGSREKRFELVERTGPTGVMAVARWFVEEFFMPKGQQRSGAFALEFDVTRDSRSGVERHAQV
jgi:hypothetical protein